MNTQSRNRRLPFSFETLEPRYTPAQVLTPSKLIYQDAIGNMVTVAFTKPILSLIDPNTIFTFDSGPGAVNGHTSKEDLLEIDLTAIPVAANGIGISVTASRSPITGGDGFARVGEIVATGVDLGAVNIRGDLGSIIAGGSAKAPAIKSLTLQSLGRYGEETGSGSPFTQIDGNIGSLSVHGDFEGEMTVYGSIGTMIIGGSVTGHGSISTSGDLGKGTIAGNIEGGIPGGGFVGIGSLESLGNNVGTIKSLTVGGSIIGGSQTGTADLDSSGCVFANHIKSLTIDGSLIAGTDHTTGSFWCNGAVIAFYEIGNVTIKGSMVGNATAPAAITAGGQRIETGGRDLAIGSVSVKGRVEYGLIEVGVDPVTTLAYEPVDADAQIGSVTVGGDWIASSIAAGTVASRYGFGWIDNVRMAAADVRDDPNISSTINSITIGGQVLGDINSMLHYGIDAQDVVKLKVGGTTVFENGDSKFVRIGLFGTFAVFEVT